MNHHLRNYLLMFSDTVLFTNAMSFLSVNAVITYFLATLGAGTFEIGLANALVSIGSFVAFALTNLGLCGYNLSSGIYIIEQIPRDRLPMGISINTMITLVVSSIITVGGSFLVDSISFSAIFLIAGLAGLLGGVLLFAGGKSVKPTYAEQIQL